LEEWKRRKTTAGD